MSREAFFAAVARSPIRGLAAPARASINTVLDEWEARPDFTDQRWLAYMLATMLGEVGTKMTTVREGFTKSDASARAFVKRQGYRYAKVVNGNVYYGRGLVQLTWDYNYKSMGQIIGVDLYNNPDLALRTDIAVKIMFEGMKRGTFTGKKLSHYFNGATEDWVNARRIINGTDKAATFAAYGRAFYQAVRLLGYDEAPVKKRAMMPTTPKGEAIGIAGTAGPGVVANATGDQMLASPATPPVDGLSELTGQLTTLAAYGVKGVGILLMLIALALAMWTAFKYLRMGWRYWRGEQ